MAGSSQCFSALLSRLLSGYLEDMVRLAWFGGAFTTEEAAALMGVSSRDAGLKLKVCSIPCRHARREREWIQEDYGL